MDTNFTSRAVPGIQAGGPGQFLGYRRVVEARIARVEMAPRRNSEFSYEITEQKVGPLQLVQIRSDAVTLQRSSKCIASDPRTQYIVTLHREGEGCIRYPDAEVPLRAGTLAMLDKALPYEAQFHEPTVRLLVSVPRLHLEQRLGDGGRYLRRSVSSERGIARIASKYLESLFEEAPYLDEASQHNAAAICLDLLAAALLAGAEDETGEKDLANLKGPASSAALLSRIRAYIRHHLCDPDLDVEGIAAAHRISKRYLHTVFSASGITVGGFVREERMRRAYADLVNARLRHLSVTDIAFQHGFNDSPHFSRCFKARYGFPPNKARDLARS
ncbi:transcriptional regulator, AraC family [Rhizobiales bacterium GAS191]|nr:transcriptional regulator, AraC family [Rhizobiales bacterium GAS191]